MKNESRKKSKTKNEVKNKEKNNWSVKSYLKASLSFIKQNLVKYIKVFLVISIVLIALTASAFITNAESQTCIGMCIDDSITFISQYWSKLQIILITTISGIVPYIFAPVIGFIGYILSIVSELGYIIKGLGYVKGIFVWLVPAMIDILTISITASVGIYICKTVTIGYKISSVNNMNFLNFRIRLYEAIGNKEKFEKLTKQKNEKVKKLESKKNKLNYLQILNVVVLIAVLQFISTLIQEILL